jgi:RNA polymerase sigma-70 factor (ECF subfamily)
MIDDKQLLIRIRCGDMDALRCVYEKYKDDMFTVALSLLHDVHASEDCLQEVFLKFTAASHKLNVYKNLKGYLISCIANRSRDHLRKKSKVLDCPIEELYIETNQGNMADEIIDRQEIINIYNALSLLPSEQQEVFVLHTQGQMKFREIANLQKVSIKTIQSRYRYGLEKLQALLAKE